MLFYVFVADGVNENNSTQGVTKRLKKAGLTDDEISEVRDVYVIVTKLALERMYRQKGTKYGDMPDIKSDKNLFGVYYMFKDTSFLFSDWYMEYADQLDDLVLKFFIPTFNKRLKNRKYGKI
jgi:hypothetical protein